MIKRTLPLACLAAISPYALAHHSSAPHFDATKRMSISGVVTRYEERNPHAYLHIEAQDPDGRTRVYRCESHGVTMLIRNGITPDMLRPGTQLQVDAIPHRRDPNGCFFNAVHFADGRVLDVNGPRGGAAQRAPVPQRDSIFGTWLLAGAPRSTSGPQFMMDYLTPAGEAAVAAYNPFVDDPTYRCEPVTIRRTWYAPGTPLAIRREGDDVVIQTEWMDVERTIHMNLDRIPDDAPPSILGFSIGRFEGGTLVIETGRFTPGVLNQYVEEEGKPTRGLLHSDQLRVVERISFDAERNRITLSIEHYDPSFFTRDFPVANAEFAASDLEITPFGCIPEVLK
jgi:hypothetical protein